MALSNRSNSNSASGRSSRSHPRRQNKSISKQGEKRSSPPRNKRHRSRSGSPRRRIDRKSRSQSHSPRRERRNNDSATQNKKLFITNIQGKYPELQVREDLKKQFEAFGKIYQIVVKTKQNSANTYAFIQFERIEDAIRAQENMKNKRFKGKELKVQFGRSERKKQDREGGQCYYCHKTGHFARECREKDRYENGRSGRDYEEKRRRRRSDSRDKERHRHRHRSSYSHSRSSTPDRHRKRRSRSRSPRYQERRRYQNRGQRYGRDTRDGRDGRDGRSSRDVRGSRDQRDYRDYRDGRGSKDVRDSRSREKGGRDDDRDKKKQRPRYNNDY